MKFQKNVGMLDSIIRIVIAAVIAVLYFTGQISDGLAIVLGIVAVIFLLTALLGFCPLYLPFGISTRKQ